MTASDALRGARVRGTLDRAGTVLAVRSTGELLVEFDRSPGLPVLLPVSAVRAL